ncbi:hypothetical protein C2869_08490 [Saccharobesus litoralis]|uniref:CorA-like Mg2+ transporter protein n=1 Tax=Saccharobesus litoralis TaxID=2172099 RepID=A0A2S0VQK5_9ALTE|nr:hypothetical protein [Saccharobesus litoralis]AWB66462.1 hypothetical protein C2869_08490 [Saccharobesus litoralis]
MLPRKWDVDSRILARLGKSVGKQRVISENGQHLLILHALPDKSDKQREGVFFWCNAAGEWQSTLRGRGLAPLMEHIASFAQKEVELEKTYQQAQSAKTYFQLVEQIAPVLRAVKNMCSTLQSAREQIGDELIDFRNQAEELQRTFELLYQDCQHGLEYAMARKAEEQSELQRKALLAGHRLNILMAVFLPLTALASLLAMQIPDSLEQLFSLGFVSALIIGLGLGLLLRSWVTKTQPQVE